MKIFNFLFIKYYYKKINLRWNFWFEVQNMKSRNIRYFMYFTFIKLDSNDMKNNPSNGSNLAYFRVFVLFFSNSRSLKKTLNIAKLLSAWNLIQNLLLLISMKSNHSIIRFCLSWRNFFQKSKQSKRKAKNVSEDCGSHIQYSLIITHQNVEYLNIEIEKFFKFSLIKKFLYNFNNYLQNNAIVNKWGIYKSYAVFTQLW